MQKGLANMTDGVFKIPPTAKDIHCMETGPQLKVSSDTLLIIVKLGIEPVIPGLHGEWFIHYTTAAPNFMAENISTVTCYFACLW